ncbi:unnamed protein product [Cuscuta campestris]|uniref:Uncharacterized protein n=1 Tax=Cuscuta campestris TaxID=132261 RepID=A0A484KZI1_9ASTE|nr:unnamed protein product [Cuscuta campestris]
MTEIPTPEKPPKMTADEDDVKVVKPSPYDLKSVDTPGLLITQVIRSGGQIDLACREAAVEAVAVVAYNRADVAAEVASLPDVALEAEQQTERTRQEINQPREPSRVVRS